MNPGGYGFQGAAFGAPVWHPLPKKGKGLPMPVAWRSTAPASGVPPRPVRDSLALPRKKPSVFCTEGMCQGRLAWPREGRVEPQGGGTGVLGCPCAALYQRRPQGLRARGRSTFEPALYMTICVGSQSLACGLGRGGVDQGLPRSLRCLVLVSWEGGPWGICPSRCPSVRCPASDSSDSSDRPFGPCPSGRGDQGVSSLLAAW